MMQEGFFIQAKQAVCSCLPLKGVIGQKGPWGITCWTF